MRTYHSKRLWLTVFMAAACLLAGGCFGEGDGGEDGQPTPEDFLEEGRDWLRIGEGDRARLAFLSALELEPSNDEGLYGLVAADVLQLTDVISIFVDYIYTVIDLINPVKPLDENGFDETDVIDRLLEILVDGLVMEVGQELISTAEALQNTHDPIYHHDGIPVVVNFELRDTMAGEFDRSFLTASESYAELLTGISGHALVLSLEMDISLAFLIAEADFDDTMTGIGDVVDILKLILNDPGHPGFLIMDDQGVEFFRGLGLVLGNGFNDFLRTWSVIGAETDDQTDDVMGYVDLDGNFAYDPGEPYFLPYFEALDQEAMNALIVLTNTALEFRNAFWDRTVNDIDPANSNTLPLAALNPVLELFGVPGFIPESLTIPVGDWYAQPDPMVVRNAVVSLVDFLDALFPGSGRFESD